VAHLIEGDAHDVALERRDPFQIPAARQTRDLGVELVDPLVDSFG
jgi:hypothetical protein